MYTQLRSAYEAGHEVRVSIQLTDTRGIQLISRQKVILVGGFSASESLRGHLAKALKKITRELCGEENPHKIRLTDPIISADPYVHVCL